MAIQAKLFLKLSVQCRIASLNIYFNSKCIEYGVTPKYISIKAISSSTAAQRAVSIAEKVWIRTELKTWYRKRDSLYYYLYHLHAELSHKLHPVEFSVLDDRVRSLAVAVADKKRAVINHKLLRLTSVSQESSVSDPSPQIHCEHQFATRVVNLSKCEISPDVLSLLNKGLKFAPAIPISSKGYKNLATDCEVALSNQPRGIKHLVADTIITDIKNHSIPARRSSEGVILKSLRDLKAENQLVLSKADKGNCTVILDRDDYT
ncbi:uncharacterized protein, partial [Hetaerina americana]